MASHRKADKPKGPDWGGILMLVGLALVVIIPYLGFRLGFLPALSDSPLIAIAMFVATFAVVWNTAKLTWSPERPYPLLGVIDFGDPFDNWRQWLAHTLLWLVMPLGFIIAYFYASCTELFGYPESWIDVWEPRHNPFDIVTDYPVVTGFMLDIPLKVAIVLTVIALVLLAIQRDSIPWFVGRAVMFAWLVGFASGAGALIGFVLGFLGGGAYDGLNFLGRLVALAPVELFLFSLILIGSFIMHLTGLDRVGMAAYDVMDAMSVGDGSSGVSRAGGFSTGDTVYNTATGTSERVRVDGDFIYIGNDMFYGSDIAGQGAFTGSSGTRYTR